MTGAPLFREVNTIVTDARAGPDHRFSLFLPTLDASRSPGSLRSTAEASLDGAAALPS